MVAIALLGDYHGITGAYQAILSQLLRYPRWLLWCCYKVAMVCQVNAKVLLDACSVIPSGFYGVAMR